MNSSIRRISVGLTGVVFTRFYRSIIVFLLPTPATPIFKECQSTDRFDPTWFATSAIEDTEMFNTSASGDH